MSTAESSITQNATEINKRLTSAQVNQAIFNDKRIKDTRNDNQSPQWYWGNYPQQTVEEFKVSSVIGLTGEGTYAILTTNVHWTDSSCGKIKQTAKTDRATFERYGSGTSWDPWVKIANSSDLANYTTKTEFQTVKETTSLYERVIGSTEVNVKDKIARIVMTDSSFVTEVAKKTDIPKYVVGRNHILDFGFANNSNFYSHTSLWEFERISDSTARSGYHIKATCTQAGTMGFYRVLRDLRGSEWQGRTMTYSIDIKTSKSVLMRLGAEAFNGGYKTFYATPGWTRFIFTDTVNFRTLHSFIFYSDSVTWNVGDIIYLRDPQLEDGTVATTPKQAPEDTEDALTVVSTRVEQTANSYSIKFLNNANDITTQLNMTSSGVRIKSSLIHLDGNVTVSGTAWMDGAVIKNLSADKITTGTLNANNVNITNLSVNDVSGITATYLQSVIGTAFIDWMKGKVIQGYNNNMTIDLLGGNITLGSGSNAIKRIKGTHTAFVHFNDVAPSADGGVGSLYAAIGVTSSGDGVNSMSSGRFAGLRAFRAASGTNHNATLDQTEIYGDTVVILDDFSLVRGFQIRPDRLDKRYDLNDHVLNPIRFFVKLLLHLNNVGWNWQNHAFLDALRNEWNAYEMSRYGTFHNNTINYP